MSSYYGFSETIKNAWSLFCTKLFYRPARLVRRPVYLRGKKGMRFENGFTTGYRCRFEIFGAQDGIKLDIGKNCKIGDNVHMVASSSVKIGDDCLMASNIFISDTDHGEINAEPTSPPDSRPLVSKSVSIGNCVLIGEGVAVLPGAQIGDGCIIGAHAVVTGCIEPYCIAVGAPARAVKRYNFEKKEWERC